MISDIEKLKQQLYEIQQTNKSARTSAPSTEPRFTIDANTRQINIPSEFSFLAIKNDHHAETIYFEIDRYFDDEDLSKYTCVVQFINTDGKNTNEGIYPVTEIDTTSEDGKLIFGWTIFNDVTQFFGTICFSIRFYSIDEDGNFLYNLNTLPSTSSILDTLNVRDFVITKITPSQVQVWIDKMNELSAQFREFGTELEELRQAKEKLFDDSNKILAECTVKIGECDEAAQQANEATQDAITATEEAIIAKERCDSLFFVIDGGNAFTNPMFTIDGGTADGSPLNIVKTQ